MIHLICDWESISIIFSNFLIPISLIGGGIWTINIFSKRKEEAALLLKIEEIEPHYLKNENKYFLQIGIFIKNTGKRDLNLLYQTATIKISRFDANNDRLEKLENEKSGLASHNSHFSGRIRPNVQFKMPYFIEIKEPGIHFIEFTIDVSMKKYYRGVFRTDKDKTIKTWSDRQFYMTEKKDFK